MLAVMRDLAHNVNFKSRFGRLQWVAEVPELNHGAIHMLMQ
jgi:hypothetical protein